MRCEYIGSCGGCQEDYSLDLKIASASALLGVTAYDVFPSKESGFRARCELGIYHKEDKISYTMRKGKEYIPIQNCPNLELEIQHFLQVLLEVLNTGFPKSFSHKLFAIEVLNTRENEILATLIYHKSLEKQWLKEAKELQKALQNKLSSKVYIIGRSRGVKLVLERDFVIERLRIFDQDYYYCYNEGAFTQPNPKMNEKMIQWILENTKDTQADLLEMYCGCGNFTIPLAKRFRKVLATEISKTSIKAAQFACEENKQKNIHFVRLSGQECIEALSGKREFRRLEGIDLQSYDFHSVLVDPPRAGLGDEVCGFLQQFKEIFYISCNPKTLAQDLQMLLTTHQIYKTAFFDQFPHTEHLETGIILKKRD